MDAKEVITDIEQKHVLHGHFVNNGRPITMFWRATGPRGKPLPKIGTSWIGPDGERLVLDRIDPPGTPVELQPDKTTLVLRALKRNS